MMTALSSIPDEHIPSSVVSSDQYDHDVLTIAEAAKNLRMSETMSIIPQTTDLDFPDNLPPLSDDATQALMSGTSRSTKVTSPPVKSHHHDWHQETVTLTPNPGPAGGTAGATVMWRCGRRGAGPSARSSTSSSVPDWKGGFQDMSTQDVIRRMREEAMELLAEGMNESALDEAIDVANFAARLLYT